MNAADGRYVRVWEAVIIVFVHLSLNLNGTSVIKIVRNTYFCTRKICEEREYSILLVMSELSTVRCDRALGLDCRYTSVECRRGAAVEVLWPMDRAVQRDRKSVV